MLENGRRLISRPIEASDAETLRRSFGLLSPEEIRLRFLHPIKELTPEYARDLSDIDPQRAFALVLVEALPPEHALIGAVARAVIIDDSNMADFALIVGRELNGFGLGHYLLSRLIEWCRKKGLGSIQGDVMLENQRMLRLARHHGFHADPDPDNPGIVRIVKPLTVRGATCL